MSHNTIQEFVDSVYAGEREYMQTDAPVTSSTTGVFNAVFGAKVWSQLNQDANTFGALPKYVWPQSGFRALTARAAASGGGVAEGGAVPDTIKPTFAEITVTLKQIIHTFEITFVQEALAAAGDDALAYDELQAQMAVHHAEMMNVMLHTDGNTLAGDNLESLDRICASAAEATALSWTSGDEDIYGIDRSGNAWADAVVLHNSGTDRDLTDALIRSLTENTTEAGARKADQIWITGTDTASAISGLYQSQVRYNPDYIPNGRTVAASVNGITVPGDGSFGVEVALLYGRPVIVDKDTVKDTISRLYLVDIGDPMGSGRPRLGISIAQPTMYYETKSPFENNKTTREGMYFTMGELVCTFFACQGKLRDLQ